MKWISVEEKLPDYDEYVLFYHESGFIIYEHINKDMMEGDVKHFLKGGHFTGPITHWMKPEPPEEL